MQSKAFYWLQRWRRLPVPHYGTGILEQREDQGPGVLSYSLLCVNTQQMDHLMPSNLNIIVLFCVADTTDIGLTLCKTVIPLSYNDTVCEGDSWIDSYLALCLVANSLIITSIVQ